MKLNRDYKSSEKNEQESTDSDVRRYLSRRSAWHPPRSRSAEERYFRRKKRFDVISSLVLSEEVEKSKEPAIQKIVQGIRRAEAHEAKDRSPMPEISLQPLKSIAGTV